MKNEINKYMKVAVEEFETKVANDPLVSVCIQTYQHERYIKECLDSVLNQKVKFKYEILLGEDDSNDGTREICIEYAKKYPDKIRLFLHSRENNIKINGHPTGRFNFVYNLTHAHGKYIALCEGDDYWTDPYKLQKQVDFLENNEDYAMCFHEVGVCHNSEKQPSHLYSDFDWNLMDVNKEVFTIEDIIRSPFMATCSLVFRNDIGELPDWFSHAASGDIALSILVTKDKRIKFFNDVMGIYRKHSNGITKNHKGDWIYYNRIDMFINLDTHFCHRYSTYMQKTIKKYLETVASLDLIPPKLYLRLQTIYPELFEYILYKNYGEPDNKNFFCTIITYDYIPYAQTILKSIRKFNKSITLHVFISDSDEKINSLDPGLKFYTYNDLKSNQTCRDLYSKYANSYHDAFRWSMKPVFMRYLLNEGAKKVLYVDSDIHFYSDYNFLFDYLDNNNILLTPHWRTSDPVKDQSNFKLLLTSGLYNAGFVGVNQNAIPALTWWAEVCLYNCEISPETGNYVDQTYLDFFHYLFDGVKVIKHKGCNVANWNRVECKRTIDDDNQVLINNEFPIVFIHFTASTIKGILSGQDKLLMPYYEVYKSILNEFKNTFDKKPIEDGVANKAVDYHKMDNIHSGNRKLTSSTNNKVNEMIPSNNDKFLNLSMTKENIDIYYIRTSIKKAIEDNLENFKGTFLDLGCGEMPYRDYLLTHSRIEKYIGIDIENPIYQKNSKPDKFWDGKTIPLGDNSVDIVMATELFEHLPDVQSVLKEINRVLKPGGMLFFTVPFLWPLHDIPHDEYRYTPFAMERHLKAAGLGAIQITPYGGWNASLAQMIGLWLNRSGIHKDDRKRLAEQLFPFYQELLETDIIPEDYKKGPMIPGFSGVAKKEAINKASVNGSFDKSESNVECPVCDGKFQKFKPYGANNCPNACCPQCGTVERHRLLWLYLIRKRNILSENLKLLDIAPTKGISNKLKSLPNINYLSIDLTSPLAMKHMDLTALELPDNSYDCVLCYHVLEHIPDDRKAIREILRVLKPGGWAILQVPIKKRLEKTHEGAHIQDPAERKRLFGQEDHVRYYGLDYKDKLAEEGFIVNVDEFAKTLSDEEIEKYRMMRDEEIYFCSKPSIENINKANEN